MPIWRTATTWGRAGRLAALMATQSQMARKKILIVDDEPLNLELLERELRPHDYTVESARNGEEALKKVDSFLPDLILLDYMMPDMSGLEVLKELRHRGHGLPVVMITAYGTTERVVEAMKEGAYDLVTKPFDSDHLLIVIKKALQRQSALNDTEAKT